MILDYKASAFAFLDLLLLAFLLAWEALLRAVNFFGFAWWAKIETQSPSVIYWVGPFLTEKGLQSKLGVFLKDLSLESASSVNHTSVQGFVEEPFTLTSVAFL